MRIYSGDDEKPVGCPVRGCIFNVTEVRVSIVPKDRLEVHTTCADGHIDTLDPDRHVLLYLSLNDEGY